MLSPALLDALRAYWRGLKHKPSTWLFPGGRWHTASHPIDTKVLWLACRHAAERAALEHRHIHRHLQSLTCRPLRRQRHLPLERFRSRQQEAAHDPAGRGVSASLPTALAPARLRAHPQLWLPRQPPTRHAPSTLLRLNPECSSDLNFDRIACSGPSSLPLELPGLRRNHACRRTVLPGSTPASFPASPRVRRMNPQPQHRLILALRHVQRLCVSLHSDCFADPHLHHYRATRHGSSLHFLSLQLPHTAVNRNFPNHPHLLNHIQNP